MIPSRKKSSASVIVIGVLVLLIFLDSRGYLGPVTNAAYGIGSPVLDLVQRPLQAFFNLGRFVVSSRAIIDENVRLIEENNALRAKFVEVAKIERENRVLREALNISEEKKFDIVFARVQAKDAIRPGEYLLLDVGAAHGIRVGMPVISSAPSLVGMITAVEERFSHVRLLTDPESVVGVVVQSSRLGGVIRGELGTSLYFYPNEEDESLQGGDVLITVGSREGVPHGLLVGEIRHIEEAPDRAGARASVSLPFFRSRLEEVFVLR